MSQGTSSMKQLLCITVLVTIVGSLLLASAIPLGLAQASTEISGVISVNMTLTKQNSPYVFTGPVLVNNGVTLTIQPGSSLVLGAYYLQVNGTLQARGIASDPIRFSGGSTSVTPITFTTFSSGWNEQSATGCIIENAVLTATGVEVQSSSPKINNCTFSGSGITVSDATQGSAIVSNNTVKGVGASLSSGITSSGNPLISNNNVSGWQTGVYVFFGNATVGNNLVWNNSLEGIRVDYRIDYGASTSPTLSNNTVVNNTLGLNLVGSPTPTIIYNNINNNTNYNVVLYNGTGPYPKGGNINATYNYWGTINTALINQTIWDFKKDFNLGNVTFVPFLNTINPAAPTFPSAIPFVPEFSGTMMTVFAVAAITLSVVAAGSSLLRERRKSLHSPLQH